MAREIIDKLGGYRVVADLLKIKPGRVANWMLEGRAIPWRFRPTIAELAREKEVELPEGFLGH